MIGWLRRFPWTTIALVVGPLLVVVSLVALRGHLWGPALDELRWLVRKHDDVLDEIQTKQHEILLRQEQLIQELRNQKDHSSCH